MSTKVFDNPELQKLLTEVVEEAHIAGQAFSGKIPCRRGAAEYAVKSMKASLEELYGPTDCPE